MYSCLIQSPYLGGALRSASILLIVVAFSACENKDDSGFNGATQEELSDAYAYKSDSPWQNTIANCIAVESVGDSCSLEVLPLIGMNNPSPNVDDIMNQTVVSHEWMGERFEELLTLMPPELLLLMRSVTAVVIDDDIRPAYYSVRTGAIYLDPNFIWLNPTEAATISPKEDFRSGFSRPLSFRSFSRYSLNGERAYRYIAPDDAVDRSLNDIEYLIASLLLHELAHANDYFPPTAHNEIDSSLQPWPAAIDIQDYWVAEGLQNSQALGSETMFDLAGVMFLGDTATDQMKAITPAEVGSAFAPDGASDTYGYSSAREDVAMLFEEVMMYHLFGIERDLAFTSEPEGDTNFCSDYQVAWGSRMRVATSQVVTRAEFVISEILPELDTDAVFSLLPETRAMPDGIDWCQSLEFEQTFTQNKQNQNTLKESSDKKRLVPEEPFYY